jgi:phage terminase large subunit GpA-like protein
MLFMTGDAEMAKQSGGRRIDAVITGAGLSDRIYATGTTRRSRKTGDTATEKQFAGGFLRLVGASSGAKLRSDSVRYLLCDEVDAYKQVVGSIEKDSKHAREGDPISLAERRTDAYELTRKIIYGSTPLLDHSSHIKERYLAGDQRRYFVPCKHCGEYQYLKWSQMKWTTDDDTGALDYDSVHYECEHCGGEWRNEDKVRFLAAGEWRPTATATEPHYRSYHISSLYSPVGFRSWESGVQEFLKAKDDPEKLQTFVNTFLGETWADEQERPKIEAILSRERGYHVYALPEAADPLLVTIGADVQKDRIEAEIVAWGRGKESWSIAYEVIPGDTSDIGDPCWQKLREAIGAEYAGLPVVLAGVDAGYRTDVVYEFCDTFEAGVHPVMGSDALARDRQYIKLYTVNGRSTPRVDINAGLMKQEIYRYLSRSQVEGEEQRAGYCHFPVEYTRKHFLQLTAEVMIKDRFGRVKWDAGERRNEALDCRVYALAMVYAYRQALIDEHNLEDFPWPEFWEYLDEQGGVK